MICLICLTHIYVYMNFFDHKDLGNHLLQLCPKVVKQPCILHAYINLFCNISRCKEIL
jgi:hypothetical protein